MQRELLAPLTVVSAEFFRCDRAVAPREVQLSHDLAAAREKYRAATSETDKKAAMIHNPDHEMRLAMARERRAKG